jgi:hypothetical protein
MAGFKDGKIHQDNSPSNILGGVSGDKIYKGSPSNILGSVKDCAIKGMERENKAIMVAAYHFLVKAIF